MSHLSPTLYPQLKAAIIANPTLSAQPNNTDGANVIAALLNVDTLPAVIVWKTSVDPDDIMRNGMDWTRVDNMSVGRARIWDWLTRLGSFNPSRANIRAGIDAAWSGTAADLAVRAVVYTHCKRAAKKGEAIFAVGTGTDVSPSLLVFEGDLDFTDVDNARHS